MRQRSGRLLIAVTTTVAVNLGLLLALVELSASQPPPPPTVATPLGAPPPPPPPPPTRPAPPPQAPVAAAGASTPAPSLPPLALAPLANRAVALPPPTITAAPGDLPALTLPGVPTGAIGGGGAPPDEGPTLIFAPDLEDHYPPQARTRKVEGRTRLRLALDAAGTVTAIDILGGEPVGVFEDAARAAARRLRYRPARRDGRAVPSTIELVLQWSLR